MKTAYPAIFYKCNEGGYTVDVPDLLGCVTEGDTFEEAFSMGIDAASLWVLANTELGRPVPPPSAIDALAPDDDDGVVVMLPLDMEAYSEKHGRQLVSR
jgi:predicted RNase H-like HicB family nuclease